MENLHATAAAGSVSLPSTKVNESGKIMADSELLRRVFEILLLHALKTTPVGGLVQTSVGIRDDHVEITISDNGKGLNAADLLFLFDAFRNAESKLGSAYPGAERNLMLARALVEKQHGQLQATSRGPSLGTTFMLRMPCIAVPTSMINAAQE